MEKLETQTNVDLEAPEGPKNGKVFKRVETNPDIKRDTSGITTQYLAAGIVNLSAFASGTYISWSSSALPLLTHTQNLDEDEASWVASVLNLGAFAGAIPAGLVSEYFGRKKTLLYLALPMLVSWILIASSPNVYGLYVGRFVGGVAVGALSVAIQPYVADVSEANLRSTTASFFHVLFTGGILFGYILGLVGSASLMAVISACMPILFFIAFLFLPESPVYLMSQGKSAQAKASLTYFRGIDNNIEEEMITVKETIRNSIKNKATFKDLFSSTSTVKALIVSFGLFAFQQLSGIQPILFYTEKIFISSCISMSPQSAAIILGFCFVSTTYFSTFLLSQFRRRLLLLVSFAVMAISAAALALYLVFMVPEGMVSTWLPIMALTSFVSAFAVGVGPIPWFMLQDMFPPNITRRATAITAGFHWLVAFGVTKLHYNVEYKIGPGWVIWNFAIASLLGCLFVFFLVPETKNRTLEDIQKEFNGARTKRVHRHVIEVESASES